MIFRFKFQISGMKEESELYQRMKTEIEDKLRGEMSDVAEAEVLAPVSSGTTYPVVSVVYKVDTHGYESEATVMFDVLMWLAPTREMFLAEQIYIGLEEIYVDEQPWALPDSCRLEHHRPTIVI